MNKLMSWFKSIWDLEVKAYQDLQTALKDDKEWPISIDTNQNADPHARLKVWFKKFYIQIIIFFVGLFLIGSMFKQDAKPKRKFSHHGINKYGESY